MANPFAPTYGGGATFRPLTPDEQYHLRNNNPYAPVTSLIGAPPAQVAPTFGDLSRGLDWHNTELEKILNPASRSLSLFSGPTPSNFLGGPAGPQANPFQTLHNVKNPELQSAVDSILNQVKGLSLDPNQNTNIVKTNVKDPATAARIGGAGNRFDVDVNDSRQSFADFTKQFLASQPQAQDFFNQESGAINRVYDPNGLQAQLNQMSEARQRAVTTAAQRAIAASIARTNSGRLTGGPDSYLNAQMMDSVGGINAQAAKEKADLDRTNLLAVLDAQTKLGGQRGNLLNSLYSRLLMPIQARQQLGGNELAQLGGLSNLNNSNTFYNLDSPEAMLQRRLGLVGDVGRADLSNNFYGLQKPYEPSFAGFGRIPSFPSSGGGGYNFPDMFSGFGGGPSYPPMGARPPARNPMVDAAANAYYQQTGQMPQTDQNFSPDSWNSIMQQFQSRMAPPAPVRNFTDYSNPLVYPQYNPNKFGDLIQQYSQPAPDLPFDYQQFFGA